MVANQGRDRPRRLADTLMHQDDRAWLLPLLKPYTEHVANSPR